jgi:hypothetical protein
MADALQEESSIDSPPTEDGGDGGEDRLPGQVTTEHSMAAEDEQACAGTTGGGGVAALELDYVNPLNSDTELSPGTTELSPPPRRTRLRGPQLHWRND